MAASAPAENVHTAPWAEDESNEKITSTTGELEVGMSGMTLVSSSEEGTPSRRQGSGSTMSSHDELRPKASSAPVSPSNDKQSIGSATTSKPLSIPSPISKPSGHHSKNSSATSPSLTLTPNSSVGDSNPDWGSRHDHGVGPSMPFLPSGSGGGGGTGSGGDQHRRGGEDQNSFGSFDLSAAAQSSQTSGGSGGADNDGLLGLEALRDRAQSMNSMNNNNNNAPPPSRHSFAGHIPSQQQQQQFQQQPLPPPESRRPPLSQSYGEASLHSDRSAGGFSLPFSATSSRASHDPANSSMDSNDSRGGFGAIGQLRQNAIEFDAANRRRASSTDAMHSGSSNPFYHPQDPVAQKFGSFTTLGAHMQQQHHQQQHQQQQFSEVPKPRHIRSVSQPGPPPPGQPPMDTRYYGGGGGGGGGQGYNNNDGGNPYKMSSSGSVGRSTSISHPPGVGGPPSFDAAQQHFNKAAGASMPNLNQFSAAAGGVGTIPGYGYGVNYPPQQQQQQQPRDALDYHLSPGSQSAASLLPSPETMPAFGRASSMSPSHSPHQVHYAASSSHVRQQSDQGMMPSQSMPAGLSGLHSLLRHQSSGEDEHPLVGEHIEVPDHDEGLHHHLHQQQQQQQQQQGSYYLNQGGGGGGGGGAHPLLRGPTHSHSMSLDAIPPYVDRRSSASSALPPPPKVVYAIKFKRSQRNFVLGPRITRDLKIGTYVKVEADRGEDLGIVVGKVAADKYGFSSRSSFSAGMGPPGGSSAADLKQVVRLATHDEVSLLSMKREEEEELLKICRSKVRQRGLPMNVVDAEYQFDRHKLTFFFEAEGRVDFRELVRDLFSMYKTRIWMQQLDKNTCTSAQAIVSPQAANLEMDYGTPIIAPASEFADSVVFNNGMTGGN